MGYQKDREILIINDFTGYGRVSTAAMIPVFSSYGLHAYSLPTALLSNTLDYPKHELFDTTDFMKKTVRIWEQLGFSFSNIAIGLINSDEQVEIIEGLLDRMRSDFVLVDPIMGDDGKLYDGMYQNVVECNRRLAARADVLIPNLTEARLLTGLFPDRPPADLSDFVKLGTAVLELGPAAVVLKGCSDGTEHFNLILKNDTEPECVPYEAVDMHFAGTGDLFSAMLAAEVLEGAPLNVSVKRASAFITEVLRANRDNPDHFDIHFEQLLEAAHK